MARYDGVADWYERYVSGDASRLTVLAGDALLRLLGRGSGTCLDIGCGGGIHLPELVSLGWSVFGIDISADQVRVARDRSGSGGLVRADAGRLPFIGDSFDAVVSIFTHTDVDDIGIVFREARRVLRSGGRLVYVGTHPCFVSPFVEVTGDSRVVHPGYRRAGWHSDGPGMGGGIRRRVGVRHVPLAELVNAALEAGFVLERIDEPGADDPPVMFAAAARTPPTP